MSVLSNSSLKVWLKIQSRSFMQCKSFKIKFDNMMSLFYFRSLFSILQSILSLSLSSNCSTQLRLSFSVELSWEESIQLNRVESDSRFKLSQFDELTWTRLQIYFLSKWLNFLSCFLSYFSSNFLSNSLSNSLSCFLSYFSSYFSLYFSSYFLSCSLSYSLLHSLSYFSLYFLSYSHHISHCQKLS